MSPLTMKRATTPHDDEAPATERSADTIPAPPPSGCDERPTVLVQTPHFARHRIATFDE